MISGASQNRMDRMFRSLKKSPVLKPQIRKAIHSTLPGKVLENALYCRRHCNMSQTAQIANQKTACLRMQESIWPGVCSCSETNVACAILRIFLKAHVTAKQQKLDTTQHHRVSRTEFHSAVSVLSERLIV